MKGGKRTQKAADKNRINEQITGVDEVRLIGTDGEQAGVVSINEALDAAAEAGVD
ncbi:MAG: translation initiation factor IF-3, partial [Idiomarina sp.]|nr:translation initiation factor IF-3 [Idiomarina sp.]